MMITLTRCGSFEEDMEKMYPVDVSDGVDEGIGENYRHLLDRVPLLRERTGMHELSGGLTNRNYIRVMR